MWLAVVLGAASAVEAQSPEYTIMFANPADRALIVEDGLEFVEAHGPWAFYRVTDSTPRLEFPGTVLPDLTDNRHKFRACAAEEYYVEQDQLDGADTIIIRFGAVVNGEPREVRRLWNDPLPFGSCMGNSEPGADVITDEPITGMYLAIDPPPPIGAVVTFRMFAFGDEFDLLHPPDLCCEDPYDCNVCGDGDLDPGEVCDDGNTVSGDGCSQNCQVIEPPGGSGPPDGGGPSEPPGGGNPPDGGVPNEPPGTSNGRCGDGVVNDGEVCDHGGSEFSACLNDCSGYRAEPTGTSSNGSDGVPQSCQLQVTHGSTGAPLWLGLLTVGWIAAKRRHRASV